MNGKENEQKRYRDLVGHEPHDPPDETRWQWEYSGKPGERERIAELLSDRPPVEVSPEQEELF